MTLWSTILFSLSIAAGCVAIAVLDREAVLSFMPAVLAEDLDQDRSPRHSASVERSTEQPNDKLGGSVLDSDSAISLSSSDDAQTSGNSPVVSHQALEGIESVTQSEIQTLLPVKTFRLDSIQPSVQSQKYSGVVMARRSSRLAAKHLGRITKILVDLGDTVESGQVLAELDQRELKAEKSVLQAQLAGAESRLEELQRGPRFQEIEQAEALVRQYRATLTLRQANLKRTEDLVKSASISEQEHDEAMTSLEATEAQLDSARKTLELLREGTRKEQVRSQEAVVDSLQAQLEKIDVLISELVIAAPFDGHVQARLVDEGVIVSPGQPIVEVVETGCLEVHVGVPAHLVNSGALHSARVFCGQQPLLAELVRVSPTIDHRTRNLEAVFALRPESHIPATSSVQSGYTQCSADCRVGQAVDVHVSVRADSSGWWIPTSALIPAARGLWSVLVAKAVDGDSVQPQKPGVPRLENDSVGGDQPYGRFSVIETAQVELLRSTGELSQVRGALTGSEQLVLSGIHRITSGQRVRAVAVSPEEADSVVTVAPEPE